MHRDIQSSEVPDIMGVVGKCAHAVAVVLWCGWCCQVRHGHCTACNNCCSYLSTILLSYHIRVHDDSLTHCSLELDDFRHLNISSHFYLKYIHCCDAGAVMSVLSSELVPLADWSLMLLTPCLPRPGPRSWQGEARPGPPSPGTHITLDTGAHPRLQHTSRPSLQDTLIYFKILSFHPSRICCQCQSLVFIEKLRWWIKVFLVMREWAGPGASEGVRPGPGPHCRTLLRTQHYNMARVTHWDCKPC